MTTPTNDPYQLTNDRIQEPPVRFRDMLRHLGPGFILSASIVGSGELIATTTLGAKAGFVTFWVILISCLVKVSLQLEFGKHAIYAGETVFTAFNKLPGPKWGKAHWSIWTWLFLMSFKMLQVGGIVGGVALTMYLFAGQIPVWGWCFITSVAVSLLVFKGYYKLIEGMSIWMMVAFTLFTFACLIFVQYTPYAISWEELASGMQFHLPGAAVGVAISAFGLTGVGGDEIMFYNYWCLEKGYAAYTGPRTDDPAWNHRARGWIRVMYLDAVLAMVVYTLVTAAFYLLGAAVLHRQGLVPESNQMVETLSLMYTESLGNWARVFFLIGAIVILFSTLFGALASWIRAFSDAFSQIGWIDFMNPQSRWRIQAIMAWGFPVLWTMLYLFMKKPVFMILIGGIITSIILLIVVFAALHFRYKRLPDSLKPSLSYQIAFWLSILSIFCLAIYSIFTEVIEPLYGFIIQFIKGTF